MGSSHWPSTHPTLLHRLRDASEDGWSTFCSIYSPLIYSFCRRRSLSHDDALDVRQNALMELRHSIHTFHHSKGRFRGWFGQIIRRAIFDYAHREHQEMNRRQQAAKSELFDGFNETWDLAYREHLLTVAIERVYSEFTAEEWSVWEEVVRNGRKPADFANEKGRSPAWVYRAKYQIIQRLKDETKLIDGDEFV